MKSHRSIIGGLILAAVAVASTGAVAVAADPSPVPSGGPSGRTICRPERDAVKQPPTLAELKAFGDCEIARRYTTLDQLTSRINGDKSVTADHKTALLNELGNTRSGLADLKAKIDAETDVTALKGEIKQIATDFRVYLLVAPQVHLVLASDRVAAAGDKFGTVNQKLSDLIAKAEAAGKDVSDAKAHLANMNAAVAQAVSLAAPVPDAVLPLTPAQYNAGTAGPILTDARTKLTQARDQLKIAVQEAKACRDALAALGGGTATPSPTA